MKVLALMDTNTARVTGEQDLRSIRLNLGLKQRAVADLLDVDQATVSRWERTNTPLDQRFLRKLLASQSPNAPDSHQMPLLDGMESDNIWPSILKFYRMTRKLTQEDLAEIAGCAAETISRWERGQFKPDLALQRRLRDLILAPIESDCMLRDTIRRVEASRIMMNLNLNGYTVAYSRPLQEYMGQRGHLAQRFMSIRARHDGVFHKLIREYQLAGFHKGQVQIAHSYLKIGMGDVRRFTGFPLLRCDGLNATVVVHRRWDFAKYGRKHQEHRMHYSDTLVG